MMKRILSILLVLVMMVSLLPLPADAQGNAGAASSGDVTIEGDSSFGNLLTNTVDESQQENSEAQYDARICDLVIEGTLATVEYTTPVEANLVVAVYTEDGTKLLGSGLTAVSPEDTIVEVAIEIPTMPYYFRAGAYLLDAHTNDPVSEEFKTDRYTKTMQDILASTVDDFNSELILNLDSDKTTNFAVFNENTLLAKSGDGENQITDKGNGTYTIENADERFLAMKPGETFAYTYPDGTVLIVNAASVSVKGTTVTITDNPDADLSTVFDFVKIEEDSNGKEYTYDDSTLADGLTVISDEEFAEGQEAVTFGLGIDQKGTIGTNFAISHTLIGEGNNHANVTISGSIAYSLTVKLKLYLSLDYRYISFSCDQSVSGSIAMTGKVQHQFPLGKIGIALCAGVYAYVDPSFAVEASGSVSFTFIWTGSAGQAYDSNLGRWSNTSSPSTMNADLKVAGKFFVGIKAKLGIMAISEKILDLYVSGTVGGELSASKKAQGSLTPSGGELHTCSICFEGEIDGVASLSLEFNIFGEFLKGKLTIAEGKLKITDIYYSVDYDEMARTKCPHKAYKTTVTALSQNRIPVQDVTIHFYQDNAELTDVMWLGVDGLVVKGSVPATDENGQTTVYLPKGSYTCKLSYNGKDYAKNFTVRDTSKSLEVLLDTVEQPDTLILSESAVSLYESGDSHQLTATFNGVDVTKACQWISSNEKVVTVSDGLLQSAGKGSATVTASYTSPGKQYSAQCAVTVAAIVAQGSCGENLTWVLDSAGLLTISGAGDMNTYQSPNINLETCAPWYSIRGKVTQVTIGSGVTSIGDFAFYDCTNLANVTIPNSVISIGIYSFGSCTSLANVAIPNSVESIGSYAFRSCSDLSSVVIPSSVTSIGSYSFDSCTSLASVTIPSSVTFIGSCAFDNCSSLTSVIIPNSVTSIGERLFSGCSNLASIAIPNSITSIGDSAFERCSSLTSVSIPNSVTSIGNSAFDGCSSLISVTIPNSVTSIKNYTFYACSSLSSVTIPRSVTSIGKSAFYYCRKLCDVYYSGTAEEWSQITIGTYNDPLTRATLHYNSTGSVEEIASGKCGENLTWVLDSEGTLTISGTGEMDSYSPTYSARYYAPWYDYKAKIVQVTIKKGVTSVGNYAFFYCYRLKNVTISDEVTSIGRGAFKECYILTSISIPNSVTSIGDNAFNECSDLTSVTIPDSVTSIGDNAFYKCSDLTSVTIPDSVTSIGGSVFYGCTSLTSVTIQDGVTSIGDSMFVDCSCLTGITIPNSVTSIGNSAFRGCSSLTSVTIPDSVTSIACWMFSHCSSLSSVSIPKSVASIDEYAFYGCSRLSDVYYSGTTQEWSQVTIYDPNYDYEIINATIHCTDGTLNPKTLSAATADAWISEMESPTEVPTELTTEPATEPQTEPVTEPVAEPTTEPATEPPTEETPVADEVSNVQWCIAPGGAEMTVEPVLQRLSTFTGAESNKNGVRSVKFSGLEPGEEYVLIVSIVPGSLVPKNLQYIGQNNAAVDGTLSFTYTPREDVAAVVQLCGVPADRCITLDREYLTMDVGAAAQKLTASVTPEEWSGELKWNAENPEGTEVISVNEFGDVTPVAPGTAYAVATVTHGKYTFSARCRVDVTEKQANLEVTGIQLSTNNLATELFRTDYASFDVILTLAQNLPAATFALRRAPANNGVSVVSARFADPTAAECFDLAVKDDRTLLVVPKQTAIDNPGSVKSSYTSKIVVQVCGEEYVTSGSLKLTVKKSTPKLKAASLTFNAFYTKQSQAVPITGATVTGISPDASKNTAKTSALPGWLELSENKLTLTDDAPEKTVSGTAYLMVETEEWAIPAALAVPVKLISKTPGLKLSAHSLTFADVYESSNGLNLKLLCQSKRDTLENLSVSDVLAPEGFAVKNFDRTDGSFTLVPTQPVNGGKKNVQIAFANTEKRLSIPISVNVKPVTLSAKPTSVTLNSIIGDSAAIQLKSTPSDYHITAPTFRLTDSKGMASDQLGIHFDSDTITITTKETTLPGMTYKLYVSAGGSKEIVITIKTLPANKSTVSLSGKASGWIDLSFPESYTVIQPVFRNYYSGACNLESWEVKASKGKVDFGNVTEAFTLDYVNNQYRIGRNLNESLTAGNTYQLTMNFSLNDGSRYSFTVKIPVKRTAVKLKLSKTSISLNKFIGDMATINVSCVTKGYAFTQPLISLMDSSGKNSADDCLNLSFNSGKLTVETNEQTKEGTSYRILLRATEIDAPVTLTVKIPAKSNSIVTASLKSKGTIDVVRDSSSVVITPTYKNYAGEANIKKAIRILSSENGKTYATDVTPSFQITSSEDGTYTVSKRPGIQLNGTLKYRFEISFPSVGDSKCANITLPVKSGTAKVAITNTAVLYKNDKYSRSQFDFKTTDKTLNPVTDVRIRDPKLAGLYEIYCYGNGEFAIGFKNNSVAAGVKSSSIALDVYFDGNASSKSTATVTLKLLIN